MNYPDGQIIKVGDLVWWNEGVCVGFVQEVMETREKYERWGLPEPSLALTNLHPYEANSAKHRQHVGLVTSGGTVVYAEDQIEDEGIGLLSDHERDELASAIANAKSKVSSEVRKLSFCVSAVMDMDRMEEDWHFHFVGHACTIIESVIFPFKPDTQTKGE